MVNLLTMMSPRDTGMRFGLNSQCNLYVKIILVWLILPRDCGFIETAILSTVQKKLKVRGEG